MRNIELRKKGMRRQSIRVLAFFLIVMGTYLIVKFVQEARTLELETVSFVEEPNTLLIHEPTLSTSRATPRTLAIPSLGVTADFEESLGVNEYGESEVPDGYDTVGWYKHGPTPGEIGPAVVLGHVDSLEGPAVFYSLGQLPLGETVEIERNDGSTVVFTVTRLERIEQETFPTERVYGNVEHAGLRLVTCSGFYDKATKRYSHNLIVYARLTDILYPAKTNPL